MGDLEGDILGHKGQEEAMYRQLSRQPHTDGNTLTWYIFEYLLHRSDNERDSLCIHGDVKR
jgi:hypothetical protein